MRHRLAIISLLALTAASLQAALALADATPHGPAEREGRTGLVFGFDGERLTSFDGAMLALRKQIGQRTGLRLGLSLGFDDGNSDVGTLSERELIFPDSTVIERDDGTDVTDSQSVDLEVDLLLIRHARSGHPVGFFYGAGPLVGYERQERTQQAWLLDETSSRERTSESNETTWRWGLRLVAGIEWFITDAISVHAEYRVGLVYSDHESTSTLREVREYEIEGVPDQIVTDRRERESESWDLDSHGARFGVSMFF
jgi:hypothetical protein